MARENTAHLASLAREAGWRVEYQNRRVVFYPPDGRPPINASTLGGRTDPDSRSAIKLQSELKRAGLIIAPPRQKEHPVTEPMAPEVLSCEGRILALEGAVETLLAMLTEAADAHARLQKLCTEGLAEARAKAATMDEACRSRAIRLPDNAVTAVQLAEAHKDLCERISQVARTADPLATFRKRLGGS